MVKQSIKSSNNKKNNRRPALSPEARENQLVALAVDLAEQQLLAGTASSQVITHYLKLGSTMNNLEKRELEQKIKVLEAKTEALKSSARTEELYSNALAAMRSYSGVDDTYE